MSEEVIQLMQSVWNQMLDLKKTVDMRFDQVDARFDRIDKRIDGVEGSLTARIDGLESALTARIDSLEEANKAITARIDQLEARLNQANQLFVRLFKKMDAQLS